MIGLLYLALLGFLRLKYNVQNNRNHFQLFQSKDFILHSNIKYRPTMQGSGKKRSVSQVDKPQPQQHNTYQMKWLTSGVLF